MKKDLLISILGHLSLAALVILFNPSMGMLRGTPEIMNIDLSGFSSGSEAPVTIEEENGAPIEEAVEEAIEEEPISEPPESPDMVEDASIDESFNLKAPDQLEEIEKPKEKPPEKKRKPETIKPKQEKKPSHSEQARDDTKGSKKAELSVSGKVGTGAGVGEGQGSGNFPYSIGLIIKKIDRAWRNPVTSAKQISCTVYFVVESDGSLLGSPVVEKSSGINTFDQAAVAAVLRAGGFPEFPSSFEYDNIGIHLDFEYVP